MADDDSYVEETVEAPGDSGAGSSDDSFTEETTEGWGSRTAQSLKGILVGIVLIVGAGALMFWNEGRTVKTTRALDEAARAYVTLGEPRVDAVNEGKLVYVTGEMKTDEVLSDKAFGVSAQAVRLSRLVELYQWKQEEQTETVKNAGGSTTKRTTYHYKKVWADHLIDSSSFKKSEGHANPAQAAFRSEDFWAGRVTMGGFTMPRSLLGKLGNFEALPVVWNSAQDLPPSLKGKLQSYGDWSYAGNPQEPAIGDVRVRFQVIKPCVVSVMARQTHNTFEPFMARSGKSVALIEAGVHSAESMFADARSENMLIAWLVRLGGAVLMGIGLFLVLRPLAVVLSVIPLLGDIVGAGAGLVACLLALVLSLLIIATAWLSYRPLLSITLAGAGVALLVLVRMGKGGRKKPQAA